MNLGEFVTNPITKMGKRDGQPWLQGTARNIGHNIFGDKFANKFEQKYLGDTPEGYAKPKGGLEQQQMFDQGQQDLHGGGQGSAPMMQPGQMQGSMPTQPQMFMNDPEALKQAQMWMQLFNVQG